MKATSMRLANEIYHPHPPPMARVIPLKTTEFKARLTALWKMRGYRSRADFLRAADLQAMTVTRWERGESAPHIDLLKRAADALLVSVDVLLGRAPMPSHLPRIDQGEGDALRQLRAMLGPDSQPSEADIVWLKRAPRFHAMSAGDLLDALRTQRSGMSSAQAAASREATEDAREKGKDVPPRRRR